VTGAGVAGQATPDPLVDAIREALAILHEQAEGVVAQLRELEDDVAHLDGQEAGHGERVADAVRRHSLDCAIKLGWVAKAVAMYRDALLSPAGASD
jgi:ATP phosphoribosyltransferase regulatory subunit HisZ